MFKTLTLLFGESHFDATTVPLSKESKEVVAKEIVKEVLPEIKKVTKES